MGYCISEADFPDGLPDGEIEAEMRRESFRLYGDDFGHGTEEMEIEYTDLPRLMVLLEFIKRKYDD